MRYCILDIETSGFSEKDNAICQISAIIVDEQWNVLGVFDSYVKPYNKIYTSKAEKIHGLTKEFLQQNGNSINDTLILFFDFIREHRPNHYVGHKIRTFDNRFLIEAIKQLSITFAITYRDSSFYDTFEMSWVHKKKIGSCSLANMCKHFGIEFEETHNSYKDCLATLELFKKLKR